MLQERQGCKEFSGVGYGKGGGHYCVMDFGRFRSLVPVMVNARKTEEIEERCW